MITRGHAHTYTDGVTDSPKTEWLRRLIAGGGIKMAYGFKF